jgi:uridylate kinase
MAASLPYRRILLKLSGEALAGEQGYGVDPSVIQSISEQIVEIHKLDIEVGIVIGGGNIVRGVSASQQGIERTAADHMGMLGTVINCIAMQNALEKLGVYTRVMSALDISAIAEPYIRRRATRHLEKKRIVLFGAGTGNPYFTTDSAATLRAIEINCDVIMKATKVDGIYDKDPAVHKDAKKYDHLNYTEVINNQLAVMDTSSIALCRENNMPILVFNMEEPGNLLKAARGETLGTLVTAE